MSFTTRLGFAAKLSSIHLLISMAIAALTALVVFRIWYPFPYDYLLGGLNLFLLVIIVDVICGPLLTLILSNPNKSRKEMILDLSLIGIIQLSALAYGLHAVYIARPVYYAFDHDRFSVVTAAQIDHNLLVQAPASLRSLPKRGIQAIALSHEDPKEAVDSVLLSLSGVEPIARPSRWLPYEQESETAKIRQAMQPLQKLLTLPQNRNLTEHIQHSAQKTGLAITDIYYLPLTADKGQSWCTLLNQQGEIIGYVEADGFKESKNGY